MSKVINDAPAGGTAPTGAPTPTSSLVLDDQTPDDVDHLWCCDPTTAWCGAAIEADPNEPVQTHFSPDPDTCALCLLAEGTGQIVCKECKP